MECKWHPGQEVYLTCLDCGQQFCRECLNETNETYYCPDCHREQVDRLTSQMGARQARGKARKPAPASEPALPTVRERGKKRGRGAPTAESFLPPVVAPPAPAPRPVVAPVAPAPPQQAAPPAGITVTPVRHETFEEPWAAEPTEVFEEPWPEKPATVFEERPAAQPAPAPPSESIAPPLMPAAPVEAVAPPVPEPSVGRRRTEPGKLRKPAPRPPKRGAEEPAVPAEPVPTLSADEKAAFWDDRKGARRARRREAREPLPPIDSPSQLDAAAGMETPVQVVEAAQQAPAGAVDPSENDLVKDEYAPRLRSKTTGKERRKKAKPVVALQLPDEYEGALTRRPSYLKAVLFGLLTAVLLAGAYAGFEWWRHSGRWIFGWVIGFAVGIVVVFASGRHFSWKLGLLSTGLAWFGLCLGQLAFSMLDVRFNKLIPLKLPIMDLLNNSAKELGKSFGSLWIVLFLITGLVAFLISFRPWPVKFRMPDQVEAPHPGGVAPPGA